VTLREMFPVTPVSDQHVEGLTAEYLHSALLSSAVEQLAEDILASAGVELRPTREAAEILQRYVQDLPFVPDPEGWESMLPPSEFAALLLQGNYPPYADCDDKALLWAALGRTIGLDATVAFLDLDGDGLIDHAMGAVALPEPGLMLAELTAQQPLGWLPPYVTMELLVL